MGNIMTGDFMQPTKADLPKVLADAEYVRQRHCPRPNDLFYLPLSDILSFLRDCAGNRYDSLLDYGCGGSPYRGVFQAGEYIRADYVESPGVDHRIGDSGVLPMADESCDAVLSTQVLEHVLSPSQYLSEALRVLRPGGTLILTTNGIWEDHGCPYDFWRWTADGLRRQISLAGFDVVRVSKLTTGGRALVFLLETMPYQLSDSRYKPHGFLLWLLNRYVTVGRARVNSWCDRRYSKNRVVEDGEDGHRLYIGIGLVAVKKSGTPGEERL